jgi:putative ABC transport system substrate-binding protein
MTSLGPDLAGKRLDLLLQMVPQARKVGFLSPDRSDAWAEEQATSMLATGRMLGVEIMIVECHSDLDFNPAVAKMVEGGVGAMILGNDFSANNLYKIASQALLHKLPAIYPGRSVARAGGLMSYASDGAAETRRMGSAYVARILRGKKPADLPVEQPTKFELVINLKTANALGLKVPYQVLALADEVIE